MASRFPRFLFLSFFFFLLFSSAGRATGLSKNDGAAGSALAASGELWCVAKNNADDALLQTGLDWACGPGRADCRPIQEGGNCFEPNDLQYHASYAFNDYYLLNGLSNTSCNFGGAADLTDRNPSKNGCTFPSSSSAKNGSFIGTSGSDLGPTPFDVSGGPGKLRWIPLILPLLILL